MVVCTQLRNTQQEMEQLQNSFAELTGVAEAEHASSESLRTELHAARLQLGNMEKEVMGTCDISDRLLVGQKPVHVSCLSACLPQIVELSQRLEQTEEVHRSAVADLTAKFQRQREQDTARYAFKNGYRSR